MGFLGWWVQKLLQLIKCPQKFSCSSNVTQQQKKIYFTPSTGSSQDVTSKSKKVKLISEVWQLDLCTWLHTRTQSMLNKHTLKHPEACKHIGEGFHHGQQWCGGPSNKSSNKIRERKNRCCLKTLLAFCFYLMVTVEMQKWRRKNDRKKKPNWDSRKYNHMVLSHAY